MQPTQLLPTLNLLRKAAEMHTAGQLASALAAYDRVIAISPGNARAFCGRGDVLADLGRLDMAVASYDMAIALNPGLADAHDFRGIALAQLGRGDQALASFERAVRIDPRNVNAIGNRANMLLAFGHREEALRGFEQAIAVRPDFAVAHINRGTVLADLGRLEEALESFDHAIALEPDDETPHLRRAVTLAALGRRGEAIESYGRVVELNPANSLAHSRLAELLVAEGRSLDSMTYFGRAFYIDPDLRESRLRQTLPLEVLKRREQVLEIHRQAVERNPNDAAALHGLGMALGDLGRSAEALKAFRHSLSIDPDNGPAHLMCCAVLSYLGELEDAAESYDRAVALDPRLDTLPGVRLLWAQQMCDWEGLEERIAKITRQIEAGGAPIVPFNLLRISDSPALQLQCVEGYWAAKLPGQPTSPIAGPYPRRDRIRIGYFSADFHLHATTQLLTEALEAHDKAAFEIFAFSFGQVVQDAWRKRVAAAVDHFVDVSAVSDLDVVRMARQWEIDIAVDLKGFTQSARTKIFAERAAPIQVNFLGYPGTMGACFDYIVADETVITRTSRPFYAEKVAFLPGSYQPNCRVREISGRPIRRSDFALPEDGAVYCCFNQSFKIMPEVFDAWTRILENVEGSVLWLWTTHKRAAENLRQRVAARGLDPERIAFATTLPPPEHLNRLRLADVFLDTLPYNAHTTASDALRMGTPVVTCAGASFAARVAASLLTAAGVPELITTNLEDYAALAIDLGRDPGRLAALKQKLRKNVETSSLFDGVDFARKLERAYQAMYERHQSGLPPADLHP